MLEKVQTGG